MFCCRDVIIDHCVSCKHLVHLCDAGTNTVVTKIILKYNQDEHESTAGHFAGAGGLHVQCHLLGADDTGGPWSRQPHHVLPVSSHCS